MKKISTARMEELWNTLDPFGREYDSLSAFERDFQRRRQAFQESSLRLRRKFLCSGRLCRPPSVRNRIIHLAGDG